MRLSFRQKALAFILPILAIVSAVYTYEAITTEKKIMRSEIVKRAEAITRLGTKTGELPIISGNPELFKNTIAYLKDSPSTLCRLFDRDMKILADEGYPVKGSLPVLSHDTSISMFEEPDFFLFFAPVFTVRHGEAIDIFREVPESAGFVREKIGWLRIVFSKEMMRRMKRK